LLFSANNALSKRLVGIHVAGNGTYGFSAVLSSSIVEIILKNLESYSFGCSVPEEDFPIEDIAPQSFCSSRFESLTIDAKEKVIGKFKDKFVPAVPLKSKIRPTVLNGKLKDLEKKPARLSPWKDAEGVLRDPLVDAISRYSKPKQWIQPELLNEVVDELGDFLRANSLDVPDDTILDFETSILGEEGDPSFGPLPRVTSSGWPYNCLPGPSNKTRFFGKDEVYNLKTSEAIELKDEVDKIISKAQKGVRSCHVFTDFLKDERVSLKKFKEGVTRLVSCAPVTLTVASRMYFGAFMKYIYRNKIVNGTAIGLNPYGPDWAMLHHSLKFRGGNRNAYGAGDYKGFDTSQLVQIQWAVLEVIEKFYINSTEQDRNVRRILWHELVNSVHVSKGLAMVWEGALPSGHPLTAIVNCLYNQILFRLCWRKFLTTNLLEISNENKSFDDNVTLVVLGDDNIYAVSEFAHGFSENYLSQVMVEFGATYTSDDKESEIKKGLRSIWDVTFLKRSFRISEQDGLPVGALSMKTIYDMVCWYREGPTSETAFYDTIEEALKEASAHSKEDFKKFKHLLIAALHNERLVPKCSTEQRVLFKLFRSTIGYL